MGTYVPQNKRERYEGFVRAAEGGGTTAIDNRRMAAAEEFSLRLEGTR
jgi:hypothetical protein